MGYVAQEQSGQMASQTSLNIEVWGATDMGQEREGNEDSVFPQSDGGGFQYRLKEETIAAKGRLLIVADGVGGAQAGREASQWAIQRAVEKYYEQPAGDPPRALKTAIEHANASLYQYLQATGTAQAGSTMAAAVIHNQQLYPANVGDSRTYFIRDGKMHQLNQDHTLTQQKLKRGLITEAQVATDPDSSVLTRSMGAAGVVDVDLYRPISLREGDTVVVCSDGLSDMVADEEIQRIALSAPPQRAVKKLIKAANKNGGFDNISVIVAKMGNGAVGGGVGAIVPNLLSGAPGWLGQALLGVLAFLVVASGLFVGWNVLGGSGQKDGNNNEPPAATTTATPKPGPASSGENDVTPTLDSLSEDEEDEARATSTPLPDRDGDGVPDERDQCKDEAGDTDDGCPDSDGDGIRDEDDACSELSGPLCTNGCPDADGDCFADTGQDQCPGVYGEQNGCPDRDGDGVLDEDDMCIDDPGPDHTDGCPDSDGDGFHDGIDVCPDSPGPGTETGCPDQGNGESGEDGESEQTPPPPTPTRDK